jgi:hypothetical protein
VTKFVGKFRKNKDYNDDYNFVIKHRSCNEHAEIRKLKNQDVQEFLSKIDESLPQKSKHT